MRNHGVLKSVAFTVLLLAMLNSRAFGQPVDAARMLKKVSELVSSGGGAGEWSPADNLVVFDSRTAAYPSQVYTMKPDGSGRLCLTCGKISGRARNAGRASYRSDGRYVLFQVEQESHGALTGQLPAPAVEPGWGIANELWIMKGDGTDPRCLIGKGGQEALSTGEGVLHPYFSEDGKKVSWSQIMSFTDQEEVKLLPWKSFTLTWSVAKQKLEEDNEILWTIHKWALQDWRIRVADFSEDGGVPKLKNIITLDRLPDVKVLHENHGFSPDGTTILFTSQKERKPKGFDIYTYNLSTKELKQLTDTEEFWDEHARYTPDGKRIMWTTNQGFKKGSFKREFWIMDADGGNKRQVTHFHTPGYPEYIGDNLSAMCSEWGFNRDGTSLAGLIKVIDGRTKRVAGRVYRLDLALNP